MDCATAPSPAAPQRRGRAARALALALGGLCATAACSLNQEGVDPPNDTFFYPSTAVADPTSTWLYVANSNADLRYNDGTLVAVDLVSAAADRANGGGAVPAGGGPLIQHPGGPTQTWGLCPQEDYVNPLSRSDPQVCCWDLLDASILNCDERRYVQSPQTVRIGSFAAGMIWQPYCPDPCNATCMPAMAPGSSPGQPGPALAGRIFIGVRGDTSLTWADVTASPVPAGPGTAPTSPPSFLCGQTSNESLAECGGANRILTALGQVLTTEMNDHSAPAVNLPDEPYALRIDPDRGVLYVGHLAGSTATVDTGGVSLFDVSGTGGGTPLDPAFVAPFPSPFAPNTAGAFGISALEPHPPLGQAVGPAARNVMFASSRYLPLVTSIGTFGTLPPNPLGCPISNSDVVVEPAGNSFNPGLVGSEMRGVAFVDPPPPPPSASNMTPPLPAPASRVYALERVPPDLVGFDIATNGAGVTTAMPTDFIEMCSSPTFLYQHDAGDGLRLYVNCFDTGEIYVVDPAVPTLITTFQIGRGPGGMVFDSVRPLAYVIGFSDHNLSVVDLEPRSQTQYHVIQRLGFPSVTPR